MYRPSIWQFNNVNRTGFSGLTPLASAAYDGDIEKMEKLIAKGAKIDKRKTSEKFPESPLPHKGTTALGCAALNLRHKAVDLLLKHGADVNNADDFGYTAMDRLLYQRDHVCDEAKPRITQMIKRLARAGGRPAKLALPADIKPAPAPGKPKFGM